jgi:hypothetical protein
MAESQGLRAKGKRDAALELPEVVIPSLGSRPLALSQPSRTGNFDNFKSNCSDASLPWIKGDRDASLRDVELTCLRLSLE